VGWETDVLNTASQRAIERLGACRDGVLRQHKRRHDGTIRDTVVYSMLATEWPAARTALEASLRR
jgi:RimJ/RimL family protein N-acetyltransferase